MGRKSRANHHKLGSKPPPCTKRILEQSSNSRQIAQHWLFIHLFMLWLKKHHIDILVIKGYWFTLEGYGKYLKSFQENIVKTIMYNIKMQNHGFGNTLAKGASQTQGFHYVILLMQLIYICIQCYHKFHQSL